MMILVSNPKWSLIPFEEALKKVRDDFEGWEILAEYYHGWDHREKMEDELSKVDIELQIHAPLNDINIASINKRMRGSSIDELEKCIKMASILDIENVTLHPGIYSPINFYWEKTVETALDSLKLLKKKGEEYGVKLILENMPDMGVTMCSDPKEMNKFLNELNMPFCLDIGHAYTSGHLDEFLKFGPVNVHIHDNMGEEDLHLPVGEGKINFKKVISSLKNYGGNFVLEGRKKDELVKSRDRFEKILSKF